MRGTPVPHVAEARSTPCRMATTGLHTPHQAACEDRATAAQAYVVGYFILSACSGYAVRSTQTKAICLLASCSPTKTYPELLFKELPTRALVDTLTFLIDLNKKTVGNIPTFPLKTGARCYGMGAKSTTITAFYCIDGARRNINVAFCSIIAAFCSIVAAICSIIAAFCSIIAAFCSIIAAFCSIVAAFCSIVAALSTTAVAIYAIVVYVCSKGLYDI